MKGQMHPCAFQPVPVLRSSLTPFYELHMHLAQSKLFIQKRPRNLPFALSSKREECAHPCRTGAGFNNFITPLKSSKSVGRALMIRPAQSWFFETDNA